MNPPRIPFIYSAISRPLFEEGGEGGGSPPASPPSGQSENDWRKTVIGDDGPDQLRGKTVDDAIKAYENMWGMHNRTVTENDTLRQQVKTLEQQVQEATAGKGGESPPFKFDEAIAAPFREFETTGQFSDQTKALWEQLGVPVGQMTRMANLAKQDRSQYKGKAQQRVETPIETLIEFVNEPGQFTPGEVEDINRRIDRGEVGFWLDIEEQFKAGGGKAPEAPKARIPEGRHGAPPSPGDELPPTIESPEQLQEYLAKNNVRPGSPEEAKAYDMLREAEKRGKLNTGHQSLTINI